jgi:hypothetical protein
MNPTRKKLIPTDQPHERRHPLDAGLVKITTFVPLHFKKRGYKKVVVRLVGVDDPVVVNVSAAATTPSQDLKLLNALGRACYWQHLLDTGAAGGCDRDRREGGPSPGDGQRHLSLCTAVARYRAGGAGWHAVTDNDAGTAVAADNSTRVGSPVEDNRGTWVRTVSTRIGCTERPRMISVRGRLTRAQNIVSGKPSVMHPGPAGFNPLLGNS